MIKGRVLKVQSDRFAVDIGDSVVIVKGRKKLKRDLTPLPGDTVRLERVGEEYVLSALCERKNSIVRPAVANADQIIVTIAPIPEPDLLTVDKILISAHQAGLGSVICINKTDVVPQGFIERIREQYEGVADYVLAVCAASGDVEPLVELLCGKFSCLSGQSAVGKTSLVNRICGLNREVGDLSEKTLRGKNTTTGAELIKIADDTFVADTPGFGALDLFDIEPSDLHLYYDEYVRVSDKCKYRMCTHVSEPECAVRAGVEAGILNSERYERYRTLAEELKNRKKFGKIRRNSSENK